MVYKTVGELVEFLSTLPSDTTLATFDYYYDCIESVSVGVDERTFILYEGVLYVDTNMVLTDNDGIPYYKIKP